MDLGESVLSGRQRLGEARERACDHKREAGQDSGTPRSAGGDASEPVDAAGGTGKRHLFLLTRGAPWKQVDWRSGAASEELGDTTESGAHPAAREKTGEGVAFARGRTDNRSRSPR